MTPENKIRNISVRAITGLLAVILAGCNLPGATPRPATDAVLLYTQAAQTVSAQLTALATSTPLAIADEAAQVTAPPDQQVSPTVELSPTTQPSPTLDLALAPTPTLSAELVYQDDFSKDTSWYTEENNRFTLEQVDDGYRIAINILNAPIWSIREQSFEDVIVEVDTTRLSGAKSGYSGLVCRHQDGENYYALVISSGGTYGIAKMEEGEFEFIQEGSDNSGVIKSGSTNRVRAECLGDSLSLYANGHLLLQAQDDDFTSGAVGLLAGTRLDGAVEIFFDNFAIYQP